VWIRECPTLNVPPSPQSEPIRYHLQVATSLCQCRTGSNKAARDTPFNTKVTERPRITPAGPIHERFRLLDVISMKDRLRRTVLLARHAKERHFSGIGARCWWSYHKQSRSRDFQCCCQIIHELRSGLTIRNRWGPLRT